MSHISFGSLSFAKVKVWSPGRINLSNEWVGGSLSSLSTRMITCPRSETRHIIEECFLRVNVNNIFISTFWHCRSNDPLSKWPILHFFCSLKGTRRQRLRSVSFCLSLIIPRYTDRYFIFILFVCFFVFVLIHVEQLKEELKGRIIPHFLVF